MARVVFIGEARNDLGGKWGCPGGKVESLGKVRGEDGETPISLPGAHSWPWFKPQHTRYFSA
jgi:hypothetical protein